MSDPYGVCNTLQDPKAMTACIAAANAGDFCQRAFPDNLQQAYCTNGANWGMLSYMLSNDRNPNKGMEDMKCEQMGKLLPPDKAVFLQPITTGCHAFVSESHFGMRN
jgi:hypothetical protein